jgi:hypothetical protein
MPKNYHRARAKLNIYKLLMVKTRLEKLSYAFFKYIYHQNYIIMSSKFVWLFYCLTFAQLVIYRLMFFGLEILVAPPGRQQHLFCISVFLSIERVGISPIGYCKACRLGCSLPTSVFFSIVY